MAVGVGILYDFPILYLYYWQSMYVFDLYPQSLKSVTCGYSISVPDTFVMGYHTAPTHYLSVLLQSYPIEKRLSPFPSVTPV